jgi:hypothetical protein
MQKERVPVHPTLTSGCARNCHANDEEENKKDDSLIEVLRDLADFNLFWNMAMKYLL